MAWFSTSIFFGKLFLIFRIEGIEGSKYLFILSDDIVKNASDFLVSWLVFLLMPFTSTSLYFEKYLFGRERVIIYVLLTVFVVIFDARVMSTIRCEPREKSISTSRVNCSEEKKLPEDCSADNNERRTMRVQAKKICFSISASWLCCPKVRIFVMTCNSWSWTSLI